MRRGGLELVFASSGLVDWALLLVMLWFVGWAGMGWSERAFEYRCYGGRFAFVVFVGWGCGLYWGCV